MAHETRLWPALVLLVGCAKTGPPAPPEQAQGVAETAEDDELALFGLATRDHDIWFHAGPRYTIKKKDGTVLASQIDRAQLGKDFPDLALDLSNMVDVADGPIMGFGY